MSGYQSLGTPVPRQKFMQVGIDVTYMHSNFSGRGLSSFGDSAAFKNGQISHHQSHYPLSSVTLPPYCIYLTGMSWGFSLMNYLLYQDYVCVFSEVTCKG